MAETSLSKLNLRLRLANIFLGPQPKKSWAKGGCNCNRTSDAPWLTEPVSSWRVLCGQHLTVIIYGGPGAASGDFGYPIESLSVFPGGVPYAPQIAPNGTLAEVDCENLLPLPSDSAKSQLQQIHVSTRLGLGTFRVPQRQNHHDS